jgi:uncharacterized integral membrane protein (TIGR00698 family)
LIAPDPRLRDPYANPELFRWAGSMEGVPDWVDPAETFEERESRAPWQKRGNQWFEMFGALAPGLVIAAGLAVVARGASDGMGALLFGAERSPVSPILIAILAGVALRNTIGVPVVYEAGLQLCLKRILRIGVALLGIRLSLAMVGTIGLAALPIVAVCIAAALLLVSFVNRALGLPARLGTLIAVGTAICGNSAIVATGPVIRAEEEEISYAVGTITVFGLLALVTYPFAAHALFSSPGEVGMFLGTAIHDTAQVVGAGLLYLDQYGAAEALETATVTKLVRNLCMIGVIPLMALVYQRTSGEAAGEKRPPLSQLVPGFVFGFVALALVRTLGDLGAEPFGGMLVAAQWKAVIEWTSAASAWCLTVAMASVGLGTNLARLRTLGLRPLGVGLAAALIVGVVSAGMVRLLAA